MSFILDIETLGHESNTVILSAALLYVDFDQNFTYEELLDRTIFVKFNAKEQITAGRTTDKDTIEWWKSLDKSIQEISLIPSKDDVSVTEGLDILRASYKEHKKDLVWIRGSLDSLAIDSLAHSFGVEPIAPWWNYRDVRTAIDLLKESSVRAYCDVPGFDRTIVAKHNPIHDCAYDAYMLRYGV